MRLTISVALKDLQHLWERMNPTDSKFLSLENFSRFLKLTDTEMYILPIFLFLTWLSVTDFDL